MTKQNILQAEAVFFDWDGTLVDSFAFLHKAHNHVRETLGIEPFSIETFRIYFGQPRDRLYKTLYGDCIEDAKSLFEAFVLENHTNHLRPFEGAQDVLEYFSLAGIPCGVVTNKKTNLVQAEIEHFGWKHHFRSVVGAGEAESDKPSPAPLLMAIKRAGVSSIPLENIWYVGDTENDLLCAENAGCRTLLIAGPKEHKALSLQHSVDLYFENCRFFCDFLLQSSAKSLQA